MEAWNIHVNLSGNESCQLLQPYDHLMLISAHFCTDLYIIYIEFMYHMLTVLHESILSLSQTRTRSWLYL